MLGRSLAPSGCPVTPSVGPRRRGDATFQRDSFYFDSESAPESACSRPPLPAYVFRVRQKDWKGSDLTQRRDERQRGRRRAAVTTCQNADRLPGSLSVCQSDRQTASQPASQSRGQTRPGHHLQGREDGWTDREATAFDLFGCVARNGSGAHKAAAAVAARAWPDGKLEKRGVERNGGCGGPGQGGREKMDTHGRRRCS